jgi:hypothetical protein
LEHPGRARTRGLQPATRGKRRGSFAAERSTVDTLEAAVRLVTELVEGCDLAGVSLVHKDRWTDTPYATDEVVRLMTRSSSRSSKALCRCSARLGDRQQHRPDQRRAVAAVGIQDCGPGRCMQLPVRAAVPQRRIAGCAEHVLPHPALLHHPRPRPRGGAGSPDRAGIRRRRRTNETSTPDWPTGP